MNINVLNTNFERVAVIDNYISLIWCKRFYEVGALDLQIEASTENLKIFKKGYYITRADDDGIFRIEAIELDTTEENDNTLIIGAYDCKQILFQRITWEQVFVRNATVENFIAALLDACIINPEIAERKINNFVANIPTLTTEETTRQSTYDVLGEKIIALCTESKLGCKVTFNNLNQFVFSLYKGVNRSYSQSENARVVFSPEYENLISSKYKMDMSDYKNVALIGGEGEGLDRKMRSVGNASGLDRREMFVDASSASSDEGDLVDYYNALIEEGKQKLAESTIQTSFEGEVDTINSYKYKVDYNLGDIVTIQNEYGINIDARIVEIIETWDNEGYTVEPVFEYEESDNVTDAILSERMLPILTEDDKIILLD